MKPSFTKPPQKTYSIPTIEKNGELAVFYNLAYNRLCKFIELYEGKPKNGKDYDLRQVYGKLNNNNKNIDDKLFENKTYFAINERILDERKGGNVMIDSEMITRTNIILLQFIKLRDFFSHYYHQDTRRSVPKEFASWLNYKCQIARESYPEGNRKKLEFKVINEFTPPKDSSKTYYSITYQNSDNQRKFDNGQGVDFFLSFFLPRSFMNEYLSLREGYKKTFNAARDEIDYTYFRYMCTYYSKRDSNRQNVLNEKGKISALTLPDYLEITQQSYLSSIPKLLLPYVKESLISETVFKNQNTFLQLAVMNLSMSEFPHKDLFEWEVVNKDAETHMLKEKKITIKQRDVNIIAKKKIKKFTAQFTNEYDQVAVHKDRIVLRMNKVHQSSKNIDIYIHERDIISLLYQKIEDKDKFNASFQKLIQFANQYVGFLQDALDNKLKSIENYPNLRDYIFPNNALADENNLQKPKLNSIFQTFFDTSKNTFEEYKGKVLNKLIQKKETLQGLQKKEGVYSFLNQPTRVYDTPSDVKVFIESKKKDDRTEEEKEAIKKWLKKKKEMKGIRYRKMQIGLYCKDLILGKGGKFNTENEKERFMAFCYLLDKKQDKLMRKKLITEIEERLKDKEKTSASQQTFNNKYLDSLSNAPSFDTFIDYSIGLAIERLSDIEENFSKFDDNFIKYLSKKFNLPYFSITESRNELEHSFYLSRKKEVLSQFIDNVEEPKTYTLQLPSRFFNPDETESFSTTMKKEPEYDEIVEKWKKYIESDKLVIFQDYKELLLSKNRQQIKDAQQINYEIIKEILVKKTMGKSMLNSQNWKLERDEVTYTYKNYQIKAQVKDLRSYSNLFQEDRFEKIINRLENENNSKTIYTLSEIKTEIFKHFKEARNFINQCLILDKVYCDKFLSTRVADTETRYSYSDIVRKKIQYIRFFDTAEIDENNLGDTNDFSENLGWTKEDWEEVVELRNRAFHLDILEPNASYEQCQKRVENAIRQFNSRK